MRAIDEDVFVWVEASCVRPIAEMYLCGKKDDRTKEMMYVIDLCLMVVPFAEQNAITYTIGFWCSFYYCESGMCGSFFIVPVLHRYSVLYVRGSQKLIYVGRMEIAIA